MSVKYIIELLNKKQHDIADFSCGVKELDIYLKVRAGQESKKKITAVYAIHERGAEKVIGYYTLSSYSIELTSLPIEVTKKLPKYPLLPASLIGRLAVDKKFQGKKIGEFLLVDALLRSYRLSKEIGSMAVIVDAKNEKASSFYKKYGFKQFYQHPLKFFLSMDTIKNLYDFWDLKKAEIS